MAPTVAGPIPSHLSITFVVLFTLLLSGLCHPWLHPSSLLAMSRYPKGLVFLLFWLGALLVTPCLAAGSVTSGMLRVDTFSRPMTIKLSSLVNPVGADFCQIGVADDATLGYDNFYDAYKLMGGTIDMWMTPVPNANMTVNYLPRPTATISIPLNFRSIYNGQHQLEITDYANLTAFNAQITLRDNYTGLTYDPSLQSIIQFDVLAGVTATFTNRFVINYLPVVGLAAPIGGQVQFAPNPVQSGQLLQLQASLQPEEIKSAQLLGLDGRVVVAALEVQSAGAGQAIRIPDGLAAGIYWLRLLGQDAIAPTRVVVQ